MFTKAQKGLVFGLFLLMSVVSPRSADFLTLQAKLYDHDYGDFGEEFHDYHVPRCNYDVYKSTPGMVATTLGWDSLQGRKVLKRGRPEVCQTHLEQWFDPAHSVTTSCGNLFLQNIGSNDQPVWKYYDTAFFAADGISKQIPWLSSQGNILTHDFAYSMEINASFVYQGGETMKFEGDDDIWVYLDKQLVVDLGGLHYALSKTVYVDSLPWLQGKRGQALDLDIYFSSRQPSTSVFGMETNVQLKPVALKNIQLVDTLGKPLTSQDIVIGKTRVCTRPYFQIPEDEQCGNYNLPRGLSFLSADWDLNGQQISINGRQECIDLDPADFPDNTRLNLTAKASDLTSRIALTLLRVARPMAATLLGRGRIEGVALRLDTAGGLAPNGLAVNFAILGQPYATMAYTLPNLPSHNLAATLDTGNRGPKGYTGFAPIMAGTRQYLLGHTIDKEVALTDGVTPVLTEARFFWGKQAGYHGSVLAYDGTSYPAYVDIATSEPLKTNPATSGLFMAKLHQGQPFDMVAAGALHLTGDAIHSRLLLPEALAAKLIRNDSLSLGENARDSLGNAALPQYLALQIPGKLEGGVGAIRSLENPTHGAPVLLIPAYLPLESISLIFFDHLGNFVSKIERSFNKEDWDRIQAASPGDTTWLRLIWYPVAQSGQRLGTGVYIVQGECRTREGALVLKGNETLRVHGTRTRLGPLRLGYLRD